MRVIYVTDDAGCGDGGSLIDGCGHGSGDGGWVGDGCGAGIAYENTGDGEGCYGDGGGAGSWFGYEMFLTLEHMTNETHQLR